MKLGYVGLGNMGAAVAARLQIGCPVMAYDLDSHAGRDVLAPHTERAASLPELAAAADIIFLCLPTSHHVRHAIFGEDGLLSGLRPGAIIIDQTTGNPEQTRQMASDLTARDVTLVDAPVSGGKAGALAGTLAIMVGADEAVFDRLLPILTVISPNIVRAGPVGCGHAIKLVNNLVSLVQRLLSFEAVSLAQKAGIDAKVATDILLLGGAKNAYLEKMMRPRILEGTLYNDFTLALALKDLRLACDMAASCSVPLHFGSVASQLYTQCLNEAGPGSQVDTVGLMYDRMANSNVIPEENDLVRAAPSASVAGGRA